jgi:hypothetical protein
MSRPKDRPIRDLAAAILEASRREAEDVHRGLFFGEVTTRDPLSVDLQGSSLSLTEDEDLVLTQTVRQYDRDQGLDPGDLLVCVEMPDGDWVALDVVTGDEDDDPNPTPVVAIPLSLPGDQEAHTGTMRLPFYTDVQIMSVSLLAGTAPTGASLIYDINKGTPGGSASTIYTTSANRPTIAAGSTVGSDHLPDVRSIDAGQYLTVDCDQIGSTVAGADVTIVLRYREV